MLSSQFKHSSISNVSTSHVSVNVSIWFLKWLQSYHCYCCSHSLFSHVWECIVADRFHIVQSQLDKSSPTYSSEAGFHSNVNGVCNSSLPIGQSNLSLKYYFLRWVRSGIPIIHFLLQMDTMCLFFESYTLTGSLALISQSNDVG